MGRWGEGHLLERRAYLNTRLEDGINYSFKKTSQKRKLWKGSSTWSWRSCSCRLKQIWSFNTRINHTGSVHMKCCSCDYITTTVCHFLTCLCGIRVKGGGARNFLRGWGLKRGFTIILISSDHIPEFCYSYDSVLIQASHILPFASHRLSC